MSQKTPRAIAGFFFGVQENILLGTSRFSDLGCLFADSMLIVLPKI